LIDKRRKMKDVKGAEYAMKIAKEKWEGGSAAAHSLPSTQTLIQNRAPTPSPAFRGHAVARTLVTQSAMRGVSGPSYYHTRSVASEPRLVRHADFSPMDSAIRPYMPPSFSITPSGRQEARKRPTLKGEVSQLLPTGKHEQSSRKPPPTKDASHAVNSKATTPAEAPGPKHHTPEEATTTAPTPSTASSHGGVRRLFVDPSNSASLRKKRKLNTLAFASNDSAMVDTGEVLSLYFGSKLPPQTRRSVLTIFSFLANADLYRASQVCKDWSQLAVDDALWKVG
jgi:F-box-like